MKKFAVIFAAVWVGFSLVLTGCGNKKEVETKAVLVKTMVVGETAKAESRKFSGTVHGYFEILREENELKFILNRRLLFRWGDGLRAALFLLVTVSQQDRSL